MAEGLRRRFTDDAGAHLGALLDNVTRVSGEDGQRGLPGWLAVPVGEQARFRGSHSATTKQMISTCNTLALQTYMYSVTFWKSISQCRSVSILHNSPPSTFRKCNFSTSPLRAAQYPRCWNCMRWITFCTLHYTLCRSADFNWITHCVIQRKITSNDNPFIPMHTW